MTGTPPRRKGSEKGRMVQKYCPIKYRYSVDDATESKLFNDYKIVVHQLNLSDLKTLKKKTKDGRQWYIRKERLEYGQESYCSSNSKADAVCIYNENESTNGLQYKRELR